MRILWVSNDGTGVVVLIIIIVIFVLIFAALFMLNLFSAKIRLTFYVDGQDVKKYYVKVNQNIEIPSISLASKKKIKAINTFFDFSITNTNILYIFT